MKANNHGPLVSLRLWVGVLALACFSLSASARDNLHRYSDLDWSTNGNSAQGVPGTGTTGPTSFKAASGGATAGGKKALPWPGKSQAENMARWKALATPGAMAKSMMNPAGAAVPLLAGMLAKELADQACVRVFGGVMKQGAVWDECLFTSTQAYAENWFYNTYAPRYATTKGEACGQFSANVHPNGNQYWFGCYDTQGNVVQGGYQVWRCSSASGYTTVANRVDDTAPLCSETTWHWDGVSYTASDPTMIEAKLTEKASTWCQSDFTAGKAENTGDCAGLLAELVAAGVTVAPVVEQPLEGPATYTGPLEQNVVNWTKTNPDGSTETAVTTTVTQETHSYGYTGSTVTDTVSKKTTTTTATPTGTTTTTTDTAVGAQDPSKDQTKTDCERQPDSLGCSKLDVPDTPVPKSTVTVTYAPDDLGLGAGACPSPITFSTAAGNHTISYQAACDFATTVLRPLLLAIAAIMAYYIVAGGVGREV